MGMIEKAEGEYTELLRKRKVVENDKKKIQAVIEELDIKKKSELGKIFDVIYCYCLFVRNVCCVDFTR
jgi:chromosome segregation ATPase